jgi:hypothetical protein
MLAGIVWIVDAIILGVAGNENISMRALSTLLFFAAPLFAALGLVGLYARLADHPSRLKQIGGWLAYIAVVASIINVLYFVYTVYIVNSGRPGVNVAGPMSLTIPATLIGFFGGAILLGSVALRAKALPDWANPLPLALGLLMLPAFIVLQLLANLIWPEAASGEVPLVVIGIAWIALGYANRTGKTRTQQDVPTGPRVR